MKKSDNTNPEQYLLKSSSIDQMSIDVVKKHFENLGPKIKPVPHDVILQQLLQQLKKVDFEALAFSEPTETDKSNQEFVNNILDLEADEKSPKNNLRKIHYLVLAIELILEGAIKNNWGLCKNNNVIYLYNGCYWSEIDNSAFENFLGDAAGKLGVPIFSAKYYLFKEQLFKQFMSASHLPSPPENYDKVLINLFNGTFEIAQDKTTLRPFSRTDFLTYQLPFSYDREAVCPLFDAYLNQVLPDLESQKVLLEFIAYLFIKNGSRALKEEKALILYGTGANGKSVFFEIIFALLGKHNVSNYSLQDLTEERGFYRAKITDKLVNYGTEINGKLNISIFKQLASGEPVSARSIYGPPFIANQYAKLIFNCNELPKDVEQTNAFFRRFFIIPFSVTIPVEDQDKNLHAKIISNELPGIFNHVLAALQRLVEQQKFSECSAARFEVEQYKIQSDSVKMFLQEYQYETSTISEIPLKDMYFDYRCYCSDCNFKMCSNRTFSKRLSDVGYHSSRKSCGVMVNAIKKSFI